MGESTGDENANLYMRGVNEGRSGDLLEASNLLDILDVFGEDGLRSYLMSILEGGEDAAEDELEPIRPCDRAAYRLPQPRRCGGCRLKCAGEGTATSAVRTASVSSKSASVRRSKHS